MKKAGSFIVNSVALFWSYFLSSTLCMIIVQTIMRIFVDANSKGEYFWKTIYLYARMLVVCMLHLKITASSYKSKFLAYMSGKEWSFKEVLKYTLKNSDFWLNSVGFAIWPMILPKFFGVINLFYFSPDFVANFPRSILSALTVSLPILLFSFIGWVLTLHRWCKDRIHTE